MNALAELRKIVAPPDMAIDLGTANTRLFTQRHGLLVEEPTLVQRTSGTITAVGVAAARAQGVRPYTSATSPLRAGTVTDKYAAGTLIRTLLHDHAPGVWSLGSRFIRALVCVPGNASEHEREELLASVREAGITVATPVSQALAAAIGAGLDVSSPYAQLLVDIGAGTTEIAVIRSGAILHAQTLRTAMNDLYRAVQHSITANTGIEPPLREVELLAQAIGADAFNSDERTFISRGYSTDTRQATTFCVSSYELIESLLPALHKLLQSIHTALQEVEVDLACETIESGLMLTGGGALLPGLSERLRRLTGYNVRLAVDPLRATVLGAGQMLQVSATTGLWHKH